MIVLLIQFTIRLSEVANVTVGVIEAGHFAPNEPLINTPFLFGRILGNPEFDWNFASVPQEKLNNRSIGVPRGKTLGGSSAVNFMVFNRGSQEDYDAWKLLGNPGWDWKGLLPYFRKSETVTPGEPDVLPGGSIPPGVNIQSVGASGPLPVGFNTNKTFLLPEIAKPYATAFEHDSGNATGTYQTPRTVDTAGQRSYAASAYFVPIQKRPNLLVLTRAQVATKITFKKKDHSPWVATGVEIRCNGMTFSIRANKEVILAAGSINTPALLEHSGIGQKNILKKLGIPVIIDLQGVGENLQDHNLIGSDFLLKENSPLTWDIIVNNATFNDEQLALYAQTGTGIYAATSAILTFAPLQTLVTAGNFSQIIKQLDHDALRLIRSPLSAAQFLIQRSMLTRGRVAHVEFGMVPGGPLVTTRLPGRSYISISALSSHPFSRGSTHITSSDPLVAPVIDPNYFDFAFDQQVMQIGLQTIRKVTETEPLASMVEAPSTPPTNASTDGFFSFTKEATGSVFHPCGTATLAPQALGGVVNTHLLVYETSNLRIVDASVFPLIFAAHLQATVYAVAEKDSCMTFKTPPLDGTLSLPEIYDWHLDNSPDHPVFVYQTESQPHPISWSRVVQEIHNAVPFFSSKLADEPTSKVVGLLAVTDACTYFVACMSIMRAGFIPFPLSSRNSPAAIVHLIKEVDVKYVFTSEDPATQNLLLSAIGLLAVEHITLSYTALPNFGVQLASPMKDFSRLPPYRKPCSSDPAVILHSSGSL
ncbi:hypothetical protein ONZ45_g17399 [Pleurotus djamor]|nr:hypothetical protein ONZ45_g17399 [Pleurotus djamor]